MDSNVRADGVGNDDDGGLIPERWVATGRLVVVLIGALAIVTIGLGLFSLATGDRPQYAGTDGAPLAIDGLPQVTVVIEGEDSADPRMSSLVMPSVQAIPGVAAVQYAPQAGVPTLVVVGETAEAADSAAMADSVEATVNQLFPDAVVTVGGNAVSDSGLLARIDRSVTVAILPAILVVALIVAWTSGLAASAVAAIAVGAATWAGAALGVRAAGTFDGSLGRTSVPAALVGLLVSVVVVLRLLDRYRHMPHSEPRAAMMASVRNLVTELGLILGGLGLTAIVVTTAAPGSSVATVALVGAATAALVSILVTSLLAPVWVSASKRPERTKPVPDGRQFPLPVLAAFGCFLLSLGLFSADAASVQLIDESDLPPLSAAPRTRTVLRDAGGDPSQGLVASVPSATTPEEFAEWATAAADLSHVSWIDVDGQRFGDPALVADSAPFLTADHTALISLSVPSRSEAAQDVVDALGSVRGLPGAVHLEGPAVGAAAATASAQQSMWLLQLTLAVAASVGLLLLTGDVVLAIIGLGLRLLSSVALIGVFGIVAGPVTETELQIAAVVIATGLSLFEFGVVRRIVAARIPLDSVDEVADEELEAGARDGLVSTAVSREGGLASAGLVAVALAGIGFLAGEPDAVRRLGVALAAAIAIELLIGVWLLRPALLAGRAARLAVVRFSDSPIPGASVPEPADFGTAMALGASSGSAEIGRGAEPAWTQAVSELLRREFELQLDPQATGVDAVFVENTALYAEVSAHHAQLQAAGLRVTGRGPQVREVHLLNDGAPARVEFVVDHPERRLVASSDRVVGVRAAERRRGQLWLVRSPSGQYRIAGAVDLGGEILSTASAPAPSRGPAAAVGV